MKEDLDKAYEMLGAKTPADKKRIRDSYKEFTQGFLNTDKPKVKKKSNLKNKKKMQKASSKANRKK